MSLTPKLLTFAVMMALGGTAAAANTNSPATDRAQLLIDTHGKALHAAPGDSFVARDTIVDASGASHVRFDRTFNGMPVFGGDFVVHSGRNGEWAGASQTLASSARPDTRPTISQSKAGEIAGAQLAGSIVSMPSAHLEIYARDVASPKLAWNVRVDSDNESMIYHIDAKSGKVLLSYSEHQTLGGVTGTGKTEYSGDVALNVNQTSTGYEMRDMVHGNSTGYSYTTDFNNGGTSKPGTGTIFTSSTSTFGNNIGYGTGASRATAGADAHYGVGKTWDFYATLGRNGIDGVGRPSYSRVHVGRSYVNAFWSDSCFCMSYGDGDGKTYSPLTDLDVAGHEMSHGVTAKTAALVYSGESGGLNEATSDIMGSMVEFYANPSPSPLPDTPDYLIGEEIFIANVPGTANQKALRYMFRPNKDGYSSDCWYSGVGSLDVHYSSGPANHFFYLLAEGTGANTFSGVDHKPTTCKSGDTKSGTGTASFAGIGRDAATKIWYKALSAYMTSNTNYAGARVATIKAANDLAGVLPSGNSNPASSAQATAVAAAWSAILVN